MGQPNKAHQVPASTVAESRDFAGPFLRFQGGAGAPGEEDQWTGSILCLTRLPSTSGGESGHPATTPANPAAAPETDGSAAQLQRGVRQAGPGMIDETGAPALLLADHAAEGGEQRLAPLRLDDCNGWVFWRFDLSLRLTEWQRPVQYRIITGSIMTPVYTFWLPAVGHPMHWGYFSCNGMSEDVKPDAPERRDPTYLWRDVMQLHSAFPLHCMVGGGDQLYNDGVWHSVTLKEWGASEDHDAKVKAPWTQEMEEEATTFYLGNYIDSFSAPDSALALAQIPQLYQWDDHDIWDGYGSYEPATQGCPVFQGLFHVARRFYLLFQHHTTDALNAQKQEFLTNDGREFHFLKYLGPHVAVLGIDMRSQRTAHRIMPQLLRRTVAAMPPGPLHLIVLSGIPLIFPKIPGVETFLGCIGRCTRNIPAVKNLARSTGLLDRFDQPEILDDLVDGWVADEHAVERLQFIRLLQEFSTTKNLRVSIVSGDAHVGGVGRLYSRPKIRNLGDDPLYMCQIISSAIVNAPPPHPVTKMLMRTNFASNVDSRTREKLVRAFYPTHPRTDKLIARRNWCDVSLMAPPFSAPTVPQDTNFGGLRFILRVEDPKHRRGFAEETYVVLVPRHPGSSPLEVVRQFTSRMLAGPPLGASAPATSAAPAGGQPGASPDAPEGQSKAQRRHQRQPLQLEVPSNAVAPEEGTEQGQSAAGRVSVQPLPNAWLAGTAVAAPPTPGGPAVA